HGSVAGGHGQQDLRERRTLNLLENPMQHSATTSLRTTSPALAHRRRAAEALYAAGHLLLEQQNPTHASGVFRAMALLAPGDERSWLGLGACHEAVEQDVLALEIYGAGRALSRAPIRLELACARVLRRLGRDREAEQALDRAEHLADIDDDDVLSAL